MLSPSHNFGHGWLNPLTRLSRDCGIATLSPKGARAVFQ